MDFNASTEESGLSRLMELVSPVDSDQLNIVVPDKHKGKYPLPRPASEYLPEWYRDTEPRPDDDAPLRKSVRACMPFMEALTFGWIIPTPTDISITRTDSELKIEWSDTSFAPMGTHPKSQVGGKSFPSDGEIVKFNLPYFLRTPEGVSTLYMPPLNRVETRFRPFSGIVDTDEYVNTTNIPALLTDPTFEGVIEAGTPLVQVVPLERDSIVNESVTRSATEEEEELVERTGDAVDAVDAFYKEEVWSPKKASKESGCPLGFGGDE